MPRKLLTAVFVLATWVLPGVAPVVGRPIDRPQDVGSANAVLEQAGDGPIASHRLIVELSSSPLAEWAADREVDREASSGLTGLDAASDLHSQLDSPAALQYLARLQAEQRAFTDRLRRELPQSQVSRFKDESGRLRPASYQIVLNGLAVDPGPGIDRDTAAARIAAIPGVRRVSLDWAHAPAMHASLSLINAPAIWADPRVGGAAAGGKGIRLASMDGGVHHQAPMFGGEGYSYPRGYPLGHLSNTNGKIIVSRAYFRSWDPPSEGDENPWPGLRGTPHGVHTAGTAAGNAVTANFQGAQVPLSGVAPAAYVMSYRVFYNSITNDGSFYNAEGVAALEDLVRDGAQVVNNSWGDAQISTGGQFDAIDGALVNASRAGVFVAMSNGNAGPMTHTGDHPSAEYINVAASTTGTVYSNLSLQVTAPQPVSDSLKTNLRFQRAGFGPAFPLGIIRGPYPFVPALDVDAANAEGCNAWPAASLAGKALLVIRGACDYSVQVLNAQKAGAEFVVVYNHAQGGNGTVPMPAGSVGDQVTITAVSVGNATGLALANWYAGHPGAAQLQASSIAYPVPAGPDLIANFSSRGPGVGNVLKPDIAAPGVSIMSQGFASEVSGEERHLQFGQASGTSMAAPHVAGAAALLRQIHPSWSNAAIKSALMSTSRYQGIKNQDGSPAQPLDMGAGRMDLAHAADPGVILAPPSLSFGWVVTGTLATLSFKVTNVAAAAERYQLSTVDTRKSPDAMGLSAALAGMRLVPETLDLQPGQTAEVTATWDTAQAGGFGDQQGFVLLGGSDHDAHLPAWMRVGYPPAASDILLVDNDGSTARPADKDYQGVYTRTLQALGRAYTVWDADARSGQPSTLPDANSLGQYKTVILQTGDNKTVGTGADRNRLVEYANNGGRILAFGQNLATVLRSGDPANPALPFYFTLGAKLLQDSIDPRGLLADSAQLVIGAPGSPYQGMQLDLGGRGDGARNQLSIDEIDRSDGEPDAPWVKADTVTPLLLYAAGGAPKGAGTVALAHDDQPSIDRRGSTFAGRTVYHGFGLEGVNDNTGFKMRADLLRAGLAWLEDTATVAILPAVRPTRETSTFTAAMTSTQGGGAVSHRWDFGDGSPFTNAYASATAGHAYARPGSYTVVVETTNRLGNRALGSTIVDIPEGLAFVEAPPPPLYLPLLRSGR
ncbi:MAG TPA: S8 family serine peptidase [Anaerolineae bacterium]|nr:S8 family serine peptidase [Anaerolineae bacterium]